MIEIEEFEVTESTPETSSPTRWEVFKANLSLWIWAAVNSPNFSDICWGLNQSPVEIIYINNYPRFFEVAIAFHFKIKFMYCIPFSIIDSYRDATNKSTEYLWR